MRDQIIGALTRATHPLTAHQIALSVSSIDSGVHHSAVYRVLSKLLEGGTIGRIEVSGGYVADPAKSSVTLICDRCAATQTIEGRALHDALRNLAVAQSFRPHRYITEIVGRCALCAATWSTEPQAGPIGGGSMRPPPTEASKL